MFNWLKFWKKDDECSGCSECELNKDALIGGLEYSISQLEQNRQDMGILLGGLLIATGNGEQEFIINEEFVKAFLENDLMVRYEPCSEGMKIWLEIVPNEPVDNEE